MNTTPMIQQDTAEPTLKAVMQRLDQMEKLYLISCKNILTLKEAAIFTGYTTSTLYTKTSCKTIPHHKRGKRIYFVKKELEEWLTETPIDSQNNIKDKACGYAELKHGKRKYRRSKQPYNTEEHRNTSTST